ncbi:RNA polymerase II associated protein 2 [Nesidiocoris tenuis]|uniref:RNA polymerase II associated protein 2 n=1 Tax=Nesidiocoris tenuis TaxID=355587 RepID=A0ABN7BH99_9HEMI|nr:RNA polymerase II associated protein 2 [Nesidiocoris tenuis]
MAEAGELFGGDEKKGEKVKDTAKWTSKDKIKQLKGIIELHEKTFKWAKSKRDVAIKKFRAEGLELDTKTERMRKLLSEVELGASEDVKDVLKDDKEAWLVTRDLPPDAIVDSLKHLAFLQRREYDRLKFDLQKTEKYLFDIKLEDKMLESGLANMGKDEAEKYRIQEITVEIEQAKTLPDAAMLVEKTYEKRRRILQKEFVDLDSLLKGLKADLFIQTECVLLAAEMGQAAVEGKANFIEKYKQEARLANLERNAYFRELKQLKAEISRVRKINQSLARTDSGFYKIGIAGGDERMKMIEELKEKVREREEELQALMSVTTSASPEELFPKIEDAMRRMSTCSRKVDEYQVLKDLQTLRRCYLERALESLSSQAVAVKREYIRMRNARLKAIEDAKQRIAQHKNHIMGIEKYLMEMAAKVYYFYYLFLEVKIGDPGPPILDMVQEDEDDDIFDGEESRLLIPDDFSEKSPSETSSTLPKVDANVAHMVDVINLKMAIALKDMKEFLAKRKERSKNVRPEDDFILIDRPSDTEVSITSDEEIMADEDYHLDSFLGVITGYTDESSEGEREDDDLLVRAQPPSRQELKNKSVKIAEAKEKEEEPKSEEQKKKIKVKRHVCY